jgi:hypothetical protein
LVLWIYEYFSNFKKNIILFLERETQYKETIEEEKRKYEKEKRKNKELLKKIKNLKK